VVAAYPSASAKNARDFLEKLLERTPFEVKAIQVDGGSEFMAEFEAACQELGIRLFVLPPRSPKLNGQVERAHRSHVQEFYDYYTGELSIEAANRALKLKSPLGYLRAEHPERAPPVSDVLNPTQIESGYLNMIQYLTGYASGPDHHPRCPGAQPQEH
jgi:transposase InsO family protein